MKNLLVNPSTADKKFFAVICVPLIPILLVAFHLDIVHWWADVVYLGYKSREVYDNHLVMNWNWWMVEPSLSVWLDFSCSLLKSFQTLVVCSSCDSVFLTGRGACGCISSDSWLLWWKYGCSDWTSWLWLLGIVLNKFIRGVATADILQMRWVLIVAGETRIFAWVFLLFFWEVFYFLVSVFHHVS